jgi:beta-glucanase (GH16 family)
VILEESMKDNQISFGGLFRLLCTLAAVWAFTACPGEVEGVDGGDTIHGDAGTTRVDGACGAANGAPAAVAPTTELCGAGTASAVSGSGPWTWSCAGMNGGTTASCAALLSSSGPIDGTCGTANGVPTAAAPTSGLCSAGTASSVSGTGPFTWTCAGANGGASASCSASQGNAPTVFQDFEPWTGNTSPDGIWRIAGVWTGTGGNTLDPANAQLTSTYQGNRGGYLSLISRAGVLRGGEIQTLFSYGYGYYEVRMKVANVSGVCDSFFWIQSPSYGPAEWDIEFLTNESWLGSGTSGQVHLTLHPGQTSVLDLGFDPSQDFHRYGFLWTPGSISYTVDGKVVRTFTDSSLNTTAQGFIMMNTWTGNANWGGGPPAKDAITVYDWVKYYKDATSVIP